MSSPVLKVEIAFTSDPLDTTPTWVDVSAYVRATSQGGGGVSIRRGRSAGLERFEAGVAQVTLSNRDRRFDPSHAAGPYFGNLLPRKQIRITATWSAVDYAMYYGFVKGWPQSFRAAGKDALVTIDAVDGLAWLAGTALPEDLVFDYANDIIGDVVLFLRGADVTKWEDAADTGAAGVVLSATPLIGTPRVGRSQSHGPQPQMRPSSQSSRVRGSLRDR